MDKWAVAAISAVVGALVSHLLTRFASKRSEFTAIRSEEQFNKQDSPIVGFGLNLTWQGFDLDNFRITRFRITNDSSRDFTNVPVRIWAGSSRLILQDSISHRSSLDEIAYRPEFLHKLAPDESGQHSDTQRNLFNTNREFLVPVWNRYSEVEATCLSFVPPGGEEGGIWLEVSHPGIRVNEKHEARGPTKVFDVELSHIWGLLLFVFALSIALPVLLLENVIAVGVVVGLASAFCGHIAAALHHIRTKVKRWLTD